MKKADPDMEAIFFTTSPTLHILREEGFAAYHLPGRKEFSDMDASTWNSITEEILSNVFAIHRPRHFYSMALILQRDAERNRQERTSLGYGSKGSFKKCTKCTNGQSRNLRLPNTSRG